MLGGCFSGPMLDREAQITETTRTYPDKAKADVLAAAEELLRSVDGKKTTVTYTESGLKATRNYFSMSTGDSGVATWTVSADAAGKGTTVTIAASQTRSRGYDLPVTGNASYRLFFSRLDYLLGLSTTWVDCYQAASLEASGSFGKPHALCLGAPQVTPIAK